MQWKKSYYNATNVSSRNGATTFGDLPDWSVYRAAELNNIFTHLKTGNFRFDVEIYLKIYTWDINVYLFAEYVFKSIWWWQNVLKI